MNDASSRSHAVLLVMVAERGAPPEQGVCLYMIDLAGSERQKRSGVSGQGFSEMAPHTGRKATAYERRRAPPSGCSCVAQARGAAPAAAVGRPPDQLRPRAGRFPLQVANNAALSTLGRVVTSLVEKDGSRAAHIGYKDSPLTDLLKCGLGGASQTALVACLTAASDSLDESLNTLRFAVQCSHVKNKVAAREDPPPTRTCI